MSTIISLKDRHTDTTQKLILETAISILENGGFEQLSVRAVAKQAGMSERTVFRYFATRDEFLDGVADEAAQRMQSPAAPTSLEELADYPKRLYTTFEERASLVRGVLHTELFKRVRVSAARERWAAVERLIEANAKDLPRKKRAQVATNINYYLSATTWNYYRFQFELSIEETIACARSAITAMLSAIDKPA